MPYTINHHLNITTETACLTAYSFSTPPNDFFYYGLIYKPKHFSNEYSKPTLAINIDKGMDLRGSREVAHLSQRELQCLAFLPKGFSSKMIAYRLGISSKTVEAHIKAAMNKLNLPHRPALFSWLQTYHYLFLHIANSN